jgi:hypothetical protein
MAFVLLTFFVTYFGEFQRLTVEAPLVLKTSRPAIIMPESPA